MSCDNHRSKYFEHIAKKAPEFSVDGLEREFQSARNRPAQNNAEQTQAEAKTRLLFSNMAGVGIKPPSHSQSGLPRKDAQLGYAKIYDILKDAGLFSPVSQERQGKIAEQSSKSLSLVGASESDKKEQIRKCTVWKYLPRCAKCGRFMSAANPVCNNPRCALAGKKQREPKDWPPAGAGFRRVNPQAADKTASNALPKALIRLVINGEERNAILDDICDDGQVKYVAIKDAMITGIGFTEKANVVSWDALAGVKAFDPLTTDTAIQEQNHDANSSDEHHRPRRLKKTDLKPSGATVEPTTDDAAAPRPSKNTAKKAHTQEKNNGASDAGGDTSVGEDGQTGAGSGRCEYCGGFLDKDGNCNNPDCPRGDVAEELAPEMDAAEDADDLDGMESLDALEAKPLIYDYHISDEDNIGAGGAKAKARANIEAIRLIKKLDDEGRLATPEEQSVLVKYVGWGGLPQVFDRRNNRWRPGDGHKPEFYDEYMELGEKLLAPDEWGAAVRSTINAHYTSPTVVRAMYRALERMGFDRANGNILEPASGTGNFFGLMPDKFNAARRVAVELDSTTAKIARHLYQNAEVFNVGFQEANLPNDYFDLAISNVPFGNYGVLDKDFKGPRRFLARTIHNYFFAKALDKVRPGGTIAFITSHYTLDSEDVSVRKYLSEHADLVGAIRLPNTAFKANAGTEVTTDIIFLRKRPTGELPQDLSWVETDSIYTESGDEIRVNQYFAQHPEMMLGKMSLAGSMYSSGEPTLESDGRDLEQALNDAIVNLPENSLSSPKGKCLSCGSFLDKDGNCNNPRCPRNRPLETRRVRPDEPTLKDGEYIERPDGIYRVGNDGEMTAHKKNGQVTKDDKEALDVQRIRGMVRLNKAAREVLKLNVDGASDETLAVAQETVSQVYDDFCKNFGPINSRANRMAMSGDPNLPFLMALERDYDETKNTATKEAIFSKRVIAIAKQVEKADSPQDALRVSLNESGNINWLRMAELTGLEVSHLQRKLRDDDLVFEMPDQSWQTAEEYLSGNVRLKLAEAEAAAKLNPAFTKNVDALLAVMPKPLDAAEIKAALGSPWIPTDDIAFFARHLLRARFSVTFIPSLAEWRIKPDSTNRYFGYDRKSTLAQEVWGTRDRDALSLLEDALNGREPTVYKSVTDSEGQEKKAVDQQATIAAREAQAKIKKEFENWIFAPDENDTERAERLVKKYNELYNSEVPRRYNGTHLTLPGMSTDMPELRPHQKDAIWRISQGHNTLLAHIVGAGKTFSMIGGSMELRRTGLRKKPMHVIPNHMLEQYTADFYRMYPGARVLAISSDDVTKERRELIMSRIATGDWDAVVVTHSAFGKIPLKPESESAFIKEEIEQLRETLEAAREDGDRITVKEIEKKLIREETKLAEKIAAAQESKDQTVCWEDLGVDHLFVDEADLFKNLDFSTRRTRLAGVKGLASTRAQDLFIKIRSMRARLGDNQGVVFATGTPIANSVSEMYNMQRFLDYDHMKELEIGHFDNWASQFGDIVTSIEMKPSGGGYQTKSRFAQFNNVPELKRLFMRFADVQVDPDELHLRRPKLEEDEKGFRRQRGVSVPASDELKGYIRSLVERADNLKNVDPTEDNMLKITSDGRKAALDMRLIDPSLPDDPKSKLNRAVENVYDIYQRTTEVEIPGIEGKHNMAQMIFCDLGTPNNQGLNLYEDIRRKLVARGVKLDEIAFVQEFKSDEEKFSLFQKVNSGQVRVLIGSTETMGAGTNAQKRLAALHHLDAPWRPRDVEQREGRILRQGNLNNEVGVYRYLTEESFDIYNWQLLERKARFIAQVMNRDLSARSVEDVDSQALSYAEMKALATGNPIVIEQVAVDTELRKLSALEISWKQKNYDLQAKLNRLPGEIDEKRERIRKASASVDDVQRAYGREAQKEEDLKQQIEEIRAWAKKTAEQAKQSQTPDLVEQAKTAEIALQGKVTRFRKSGAFSLRVRSAEIDDKDTAGDHLAALESDLMKTVNPTGDFIEVGEYLGFSLLAQPSKVVGGEVKFYIRLNDEEAQQIPPSRETGRTFDADGKSNNVSRLRRALSLPEKRLDAARQDLEKLESEMRNVQGAAAGFEHAERLGYLRKRAREIADILESVEEGHQQSIGTEE